MRNLPRLMPLVLLLFLCGVSLPAEASVFQLFAKKDGTFRTAVKIDGVEVLDAESGSDISLTVANAANSPEAFNIGYPGQSTDANGNITYGAAAAAPTGKAPITVSTTVTRTSPTTWRKVVTLFSSEDQVFYIASKLTGKAQAYYNFGGVSDTPQGPNDSGIASYFQSSGIRVDASSVVGMIADDGYHARWNLGRSAPNSNVSGNFANGVGCTYGYNGQPVGTIRLAAGVPMTLRFFYFLSPASKYEFQKESQLCFAVAHGAPYADDFRRLAYATCWAQLRTMSHQDQVAFAQPSTFYPYAGWVRDTFWTTMILDDPDISRQLYQNFVDATDWSTGFSVCALNDDRTTLFRTKDETPMLMLTWAAWLKRRFGYDVLTAAQRDKIVSVIRQRFADGDGVRYRATDDGTCIPAPRMGFHDGYNVQGRYYETAYNQGWTHVSFLAARELGADISAADLEMTANAYISMYVGDHLTTMIIDGNDKDYMGSTDLMPEYFANFMFDTTILGRDRALSQYRKLKAYRNANGSFKSLCIAATGAYQMDGSEWLGAVPPGGGGEAMDGGGWLWLDYATLYVAKWHGLETHENLLAAWKSRLSLEQSVVYTLHEYLNNAYGVSGFPANDSASPVYGWNAAIAASLENFLTAPATRSQPARPPVAETQNALPVKAVPAARTQRYQRPGLKGKPLQSGIASKVAG